MTTDSLDVLFKRTLPALRKKYGEVKICFYSPDGTECVHITKRNPTKDEWTFLSFHSADTPAKALGLAVEKLMDMDKEA